MEKLNNDNITSNPAHSILSSTHCLAWSNGRRAVIIILRCHLHCFAEWNKALLIQRHQVKVQKSKSDE